MMEAENTVQDTAIEKLDSDNMAPQDSEGAISDSDIGHSEQKENKDPMIVSHKVDEGETVCSDIERKVEQMTMPANSGDDGELEAEAEDGEILEDGEIATDNDDDGEINEEVTEEGEEVVQSPSKTGSSKSRGSGHRDEHKRRGHERRERHSKRRRTSKEDSHKDKQKKKRHKEKNEYEKSGEEYDGSWSDTRREKSDRKRDHNSPGHDSHGEERRKHDKDSDKHRRGSGENRHHSSRDKDRGRDRNASEKDKTRDRDHDKSEKKDRERRGRDGREVKDAGYQGFSDDHHDNSPPGIYDSPSDDEYDASRYAEKVPNYDGEEDYNMDMEPHMMKGKRNQKKKFDRRRPREGGDFEEEQPAKKKPLLQTPMEERPVCRFFMEGKCQKGQDCPFNHDYHPQKRFELCKYHLTSYCRKEACVFMHEDFPCKYFHTGSTCYQGDKCKFSHEPLTPDTEMALKNLLKDKEIFKHNQDEEFVEKKHKKKGLLGDQPGGMSEDEIKRKLNTMRSIPSIFDIQTHKPNENANKPPGNMGPPGPNMGPNMGPQGPFPDGMPPGGPNMRFPGPPNNQMPPPFLGPAAPGMEVPMSMQGPPPMSGPMASGPGMGPGPGPMMSTAGMPGQGMQGPPGMPGNQMGQPMSQAAALVGAILRAAPMLQGYRGPGPQGPGGNMPNNMQGDPRFMGPNMMGGPNIENPNMMVPPPNMSGPMMSPGQDANQGMQGSGPNPMTGGSDMNMQQMPNAPVTAGNVRDPRKSNDPRMNKGGDSDMSDIDMRQGQNTAGNNLGDEDLRQDFDMRKEEASSNQGDHTPQQDWDDENMDISNDEDGGEEDMEIPDHLPPKQREMFLRIKQQTLKMKREKSQQQTKPENTETSSKLDDDKWYSSDEEDDIKPNVSTSNVSTSKSQTDVSSNQPASASSSIDVMQMINAIKSSNSSTNVSPSRPLDPRKQMPQQMTHVKPVIPRREPAMIYSRDGDCPWRVFRVMYVKDRIPDNIDLKDDKYKADPRIQKIVKLQAIESGQVIDHSKTPIPVKSESQKSDVTLPNLLDPKVYQNTQQSSSRPELAPFVDPRLAGKPDNVSQRLTPEIVPPKPADPRLKAGGGDPRVQRILSNPGNTVPTLPSRLSDPRLSRQDSNSSTPMAPAPRIDPRLGRQNSQDNQSSKMSTPPPQPMNRQTSIPEPKIAGLDSLPKLPMDLGLGGMGGFNDPRLGGGSGDPRLSNTKTMDSSSFPYQRQSSLTGYNSDKDSSSGESPKPKLDYRNDPRFKRKRIAEPVSSPDPQIKRLNEQRKASTEYTSPLGGEPVKTEESGYNSYNRPRPAVKPTTQSQNSNIPKQTVTSAGSSPDLTTHEILDSISIMPPPSAEAPQSDKNLKDIFKTIDPTASPFC